MSVPNLDTVDGVPDAVGELRGGEEAKDARRVVRRETDVEVVVAEESLRDIYGPTLLRTLTRGRSIKNGPAVHKTIVGPSWPGTSHVDAPCRQDQLSTKSMQGDSI